VVGGGVVVVEVAGEGAGDGAGVGAGAGIGIEEGDAQGRERGRGRGRERGCGARARVGVEAGQRGAGEGLVEQDAEAVPVARGGQGLAAGLLGGHVRGGAGVALVAGVGVGVDEAEVEDDDATAGGDEDVAGFEVAMEATGAVEGVEAADQLDGGVAQAGLVDGGAQVLVEADAGDQLHDDEPFVGAGALASLVAELVEGDEVRVVEVGDAAKLVFESFDGGGVDRAEGLDGDLFAARAGGLMDDAHAAVAEHASEAVGAEAWGGRGDAEEFVADAGEGGLAGEVAVWLITQALQRALQRVVGARRRRGRRGVCGGLRGRLGWWLAVGHGRGEYA
jgi:hypothetical protein